MLWPFCAGFGSNQGLKILEHQPKGIEPHTNSNTATHTNSTPMLNLQSSHVKHQRNELHKPLLVTMAGKKAVEKNCMSTCL